MCSREKCDSFRKKWNLKWLIPTALVAFILLCCIVFAVAAFGVLRRVSISVEEASLTRFALFSSSSPVPATALAYNLSLTLAVRNRNWFMEIKNEKLLDSTYSFEGQQFGREKVAGEGTKYPALKTAVYHVSTSSDGSYVMLGNSGVAEYRKENATGVFQVEVTVSGRFKYTGRHTRCGVEATCPLKLQLGSSTPSGTTAVVFQKVDCKLTKPGKKYC